MESHTQGNATFTHATNISAETTPKEKESQKGLPQLHDAQVSPPNTSPRKRKIIRMPTKSEILIESSNYHRIKKFEKVKNKEPILKKATVTTTDILDGE